MNATSRPPQSTSIFWEGHSNPGSSLVHERARSAAVWRTLNVDTGHSCPTRRYDPSDSDMNIVEDGFVRERQEQLFERIPLREHPTLSKAEKKKN